MSYNREGRTTGLFFPLALMSSSPLDSSAPFFYQETPSRILLIESDVPTADELCGVLERAGYRVEVATSGKYALLVAGGFEADLVLLDTELADMTSAEMTLVLKSTPALAKHYRHVPILFLARPDWLINQRFRQQPETPMSDYLFKPVKTTLLLERVQRALEASFGK
jgi:CheY-like chemotaxis protein